MLLKLMLIAFEVCCVSAKDPVYEQPLTVLYRILMLTPAGLKSRKAAGIRLWAQSSAAQLYRSFSSLTCGYWIQGCFVRRKYNLSRRSPLGWTRVISTGGPGAAHRRSIL